MSSVERIDLAVESIKSREEYQAGLEEAFPLACRALGLCFQAKGISARWAGEIASDDDFEAAKKVIEAIECTGQIRSNVRGCGSTGRCGMQASPVSPLQK